ncbi:MAG: hypothetical protein EAZ97_02020 [Bacteroidetes bacterium]|nr:MAG: hypothetical protein EAZ97_02020 [Bacteroidota bacterium]
MKLLLFVAFFAVCNSVHGQWEEKKEEPPEEAKEMAKESETHAQILEVSETNAKYTFKFPEVNVVDFLSFSDLKTLNAEILTSVFGESIYINGKEERVAALSAKEILEHLKLETYKTNGMGTVGCDYEVLCNHNQVLSIRFTVNFMGAYPSVHAVYASFSLTQGERRRRISLYDICKDNDAKSSIYDMIHLKMKERGRQRIKELNLQDTQIIEALRNPPQPNRDRELDFIVTDAGIIFYSPFGFPHVMLAAEPNPEYLFSWAELKDKLNQSSVVRYFFEK